MYLFDREVYERGDAIAISFHIEDLQYIDDTLTDQEAREVLARFEKHHEGSDESLWEDIKLHIDMYREEQEDGTASTNK